MKAEKYQFINILAKNLATPSFSQEKLYALGLIEFKKFSKITPPKIIAKFQVWHIKQFLLDCIEIFNAEIKALKKINRMLEKEEIRIKTYSDRLHKNITNQMVTKVIDDFEFDASFAVFSSDAECNNKYKVEDGDPFFECNSYSLFKKNLEESYYNDNWNEDINSFVPFKICYTMHCLIYDANIKIEDILKIDQIWIELKVNYQFTKKIT